MTSLGTVMFYAVKEMLKMYGKAKMKIDPQSWLAYKLIRNEYFSDIRDAKVTFDETKLPLLIDKENNTKQWWKVLKHIKDNYTLTHLQSDFPPGQQSTTTQLVEVYDESK